MSVPLDERSVARLADRMIGTVPSLDPGPRLLLLRDVLGQPTAADVVVGELTVSRAVSVIVNEQRDDGGWGRFHSADSRASQRIPTTEFAVRRLLAMGLPRSAPVLRRAAVHCQLLLSGGVPFPDPPERNERWEPGWRLFVASTLSLLDPAAAGSQPVAQLWLAVLREAFGRGRLEPAARDRRVAERAGIAIAGSYLELDNRYLVELVGARGASLPAETRRAFVSWLIHRPMGIGYLGVGLRHPPDLTKPGAVDRWMTSWELVSRIPGWEEEGAGAVGWLWSQQRDGRWDLGQPASRSTVLPLSRDWRSVARRRADWSARVLALAARMTRASSMG